MAYLMLAESYQPQGELTLAAENTRKAYELRERTSDHEKLNIVAFYDIVVTGNLEAARRSYELVAQTYPRDEAAQVLLWFIHLTLGDYAGSDVAARRAFEINPDSSNNYVSLIYCDQYLGRLDQAKALVEQSRAKKLNSPWYPLLLYVVDFLQNDPAGDGATSSRGHGNSGCGGSNVFSRIRNGGAWAASLARHATLRVGRPIRRDARRKRKPRQSIRDTIRSAKR